MSRRQSSNQSVSLFPFLAVLVCAMGALIFLLIVTTRRIRLEAVAKAYEAQSQSVETERTPAETPAAPPLATAPTREEQEQKWKGIVARLEAEHTTRLKRLKDQETAAALYRQRVEETRRALAATEKQFHQLAAAQQNKVDGVRTIDLEKAALAREMAELKTRIRQTRHNNSNASTRYEFVAFDGKSGTTRRPILIECTENSIRFIPENIAVTPADLDGFTVEYNPLLAGARTLVDYWTLWGRMHSEPEPQPYVLLIVRPSGSVAFYVARKLLAKIGTPYGYELVEEDWQFAVPEADPEARAACQSAIDRVLAERQRLAVSLAQGQLTHGQLRLSGGGQRFEVEGINGKSGSSVESGQGGAFRNAPGEGGGGIGNRSTGGSFINGGSSAGPGRLDRGTSREPGAFANGNGDGAMPPEVRAMPGRPLAAGTHFGQSANGTSDFQRSGTTGEIGTGAAGDGNSDQGLPEVANSGEGNPRDPASVGDRSDDGNPDGRGDSAVGRDFTYGGNGNAAGNGYGDKRGEPIAGTGKGVMTSGQTARSSSAAGESSGSSQSSAEQAFGDIGNNTAGSPGLPGGEGPTSIPSFSKTFGNSNSPDPREQAIKRQWGIAKPKASIGYERDVTVGIFADRIQVADSFTVPAGRGESRDELVENVVNSIDAQARTWGSPPGNFYWVPKVKFVVHPGGNQHYERLHPQLRKWGLFSTVQFSLDEGTSGE